MVCFDVWCVVWVVMKWCDVWCVLLWSVVVVWCGLLWCVVVVVVLPSSVNLTNHAEQGYIPHTLGLHKPREKGLLLGGGGGGGRGGGGGWTGRDMGRGRGRAIVVVVASVY